MKKPKNKEESDYMAAVADLGCIICGARPELHHPRTGVGLGLKSSHFDVIPLCSVHHRTGGYGVAIHAGQEKWEEKHGTEKELVQRVKMMVADKSALNVSNKNFWRKI